MLRKVSKILVIVIVLGFIAIQFVRPDFTNPPVVQAETLAASTDVPPEVQRVLTRSCNDCHSNETVYPWYSNVTPFNWFLSDHIDEGRHELNFSKWNTYTREQKIHKLDELCEVVEEGAMPLPSYLWIHHDAALSQAESQLLCGWARAEGARIETSTAAQPQR
ncbi:MAG TPA: heme-binding domain-containing protein [Pyrinomonadaceae bacterium]